MKHVLLFLIISFSITFSSAQSLTPQVTAAAGSSFNNGSNQLDWTLGEPVTATLNNPSNNLTQGFHQNDILTVSIDKVSDSYGVSVYPNPTAEMVNIEFAKTNDHNLVELYTMEGKLISTQSIYSKSMVQLDMTNNSSGIYLLKINNNSAHAQSFQIIKTK